MMSLIRARVPSLVVFAGIQSALWGYVYSQWREPSEFNVPLKSAIPKGAIGRHRYVSLPAQGLAA
ncbi:hypothetical protein BDY19DRAFT_995781 [Irpex rosettiformis]|uniref:Uncharacterized protein n=1 Tax=Irpex rosettiformis TaxID=378272 RepID=A0ACB8TX22_9APHY|nr:hypothetical protein BDY19DRAFT_995781 [Irpex rosettiformis]